MDFVSGLPRTRQGHDFIWVIVDRLAVRTTHTMDKLAELYVQNIVRLHGVLCSIDSDRDSRFASLLEEFATRARDKDQIQHNLSSPNRRTV